jgi:spermidine synthase
VKRASLMVVVALSGAAVLTIEILGTRLLGPYYGVSLFLWSALISVTLAALSLGYALGGRWADRHPAPARLALLLAIAGLWILCIPWLRIPLLGGLQQLGLRVSVLIGALVLFFPPLTLLGMVSPYAIRLRASRIESVGSTAGDLYAVSTLASVGAALVTGFWLIPLVGVTRLTVATGLVLLLASMVTYLASGQARGGSFAALLLAIPAAGIFWRAVPPEATDGRVRFVGQSPYAEIRVVDQNGLRYLLVDGGIHTIVRPGTSESRHPYVHVAGLANELFPKPGTLLLVGLGGGATARMFRSTGWRVHAVDIDPLVPQVARDWFDFKASDATVSVADGRWFLAHDPRHWDVIFLDAFGSSSIPFHLVTSEAFALARARLAPGGVLMMNVESVGWQDVLVRSLGATLHARFRHVVALPIAEPPDQLGNVILMASDRPLEISDAALGNPLEVVTDEYLHWRSLLRNHAWDNRFDPGTTGTVAAAITDDLNPSDIWAERINRIARVDLHKQFGTAVQTW